MNKTIPNVFPRVTNQEYKIAIIGDCPGENEELVGSPLTGMPGRILDGVLSTYGILRHACFVGYVCQTRPPKNKIELLSWEGQEIQSGLSQLFQDLTLFQPNLILCLGASALRAFKGHPASIDSWRGSLFRGINGMKCLATYHPSAILRVYENMFPFRCDIKKARTEGTTSHLLVPQRTFHTQLPPEGVIDALRNLQTHKPTIALDIEGYVNRMTCLSIAPSSDEAFIIPFTNSFWPEDLEVMMWRELAIVMADPEIPKILQNAMYDLFVLQYSYKLPVIGLVDDTMLKHWELVCEAPKSLAFQTSIYTREPYYKSDRQIEDQQTHYMYCCKDSAVTYEINDVLDKQLMGSSKDHYKFNLSLLEPLLYMEHRGIAYDKPKAAQRRQDLLTLSYRLQWVLDRIAGKEEPENWLPICAKAFCFSRDLSLVLQPADMPVYATTMCYAWAVRAAQLLAQPTLTLSEQGELSALIEKAIAKRKAVCEPLLPYASLNVESSPQISDFLYRVLGLPVQYKKEKGRLTDKETTEVLALLNLYKKTNDKTLKLILTIRALRTRAGVLEASTDPDNRIRCGYNAVGTETGRLACYASPTGSGFNLQTVTKKDRDLFLPDDGYWLFQCDLSGADGWTVAAHCKTCGDATMFDDYVFGLKPAKIIALMYLGYKVNSMQREEIKLLADDIKDGKATKINPHNWLYFGCKRVQHGSNYGMKGRTMSDQILKDSYKLFGEPVSVQPTICDALQTMYFRRYPGVLSLHEKLKQQIKQYGSLISANGHKRVFFGRRTDYDTFKQACADEPQNNTTYATNLAMYRLWTDSDNRTTETTTLAGAGRERGVLSRVRTQLRIQPLHQVHDALIGQFPKSDTAWAVDKIKSYFNNTLTIANQRIIIPFEGAYGPSWGQLGTEFGGGVI